MHTQTCVNLCICVWASACEHTNMHTLLWALWLKLTVCHCCLFICQSGHPESSVLKSDPVCMCARSVFPFYQIPLEWHASQGIILSDIWVLLLCSVQEARPSGQARNGALGLIQFPSSPVVFNVSWNWGSSEAPLMGSSAQTLGSLCCVLVSCIASGSAAEVRRAGCYHESMWQTHFLRIAYLHAVPKISLSFGFQSKINENFGLNICLAHLLMLFFCSKLYCCWVKIQREAGLVSSTL